MSDRPLGELRITDPAHLDEIVWFHDADFDVDEIMFDAEAQTVEIAFVQDVRQLPSDLDLPALLDERRRWFGSEAFLPFVECRLLVRRALGISIVGEMTWGMLEDASFDSERKELRIAAVFGPSVHIQVEALDATVSASGRIRYYKRLRLGLFGDESVGKRHDVSEMDG